MGVDWDGGAERLEHADLLRRVRDVVVAPDHVRDPVEPVLERRREVVRGAPVGADEHEILELLVRELDAAADRIVPGGYALIGHPDPDCALLLVCRALLEEAGRLLLAALQAVELERRLPVPTEPEPPERLENVLGRVGDFPAGVRVLDPKQELPALVPCEQPVEERGVDSPDVEEAGRARSEADSDGHRAV